MIRKERLLSLFQKLVSIDSPSFGEKSVGAFLKNYLGELGISMQEDDASAKIGGSQGNLYACLPGTLNLPPLLFCAHMDTVEPSHNKQMQTDANGVITSAGETVLGADDCAGLAELLEAMTVIHEKNLPHRPIELLFTVAEEPYCCGIKEFDFSKLQSKEAYVLDLSGPVGEAAYQAPTILSFTVTITGRSAHAGFSPEMGIHAIAVAAKAIAAIPCGRIGESTLNLGTITGGTANNVVPERCVLTGEIRSYSDEEAKNLLRDVTRKIEETAKASGAKVEVTHTVHVTAYRTDTGGTTVDRFRDACRELNLSGNLRQTFGGSDANVLAQHGITSLVVANAMNNCHSCEEYTTEDELKRAADLTLVLMLSKE